MAHHNVGTCLWHVSLQNSKLSTHHPTCRRHVPTLWRYRFEKFDTTSYQEIILSLGFFRRETASGFYPWGNVVSPRERVAEGLCGWRHGNSFPMTQSAQSLRQMRSIPHCPKAVFLCFCFWFHSRFGNNASSMPRYFLLNPNSWLGVKHKKKEQRIRHSFFLCKSWKELLIS